MNLKYKGYFNFSGGYNDTSSQDILKDNELSICDNVVITQKGALSIRKGTENTNLISKKLRYNKKI